MYQLSKASAGNIYGVLLLWTWGISELSRDTNPHTPRDLRVEGRDGTGKPRHAALQLMSGIHPLKLVACQEKQMRTARVFYFYLIVNKLDRRRWGRGLCCNRKLSALQLERKQSNHLQKIYTAEYKNSPKLLKTTRHDISSLSLD